MFVFLDLETTGLDPYSDQLLEIGAVAVHDDLTEYANFQEVARLDFGRQMSRSAREMHHRNGLMTDSYKSDLSAGDLVNLFSRWVRELPTRTGKDHEHVVCGSGVAHFDLPWMKAQAWPVLYEFQYWTLDVGVIRRSMQVWGVKPPDVPGSAGPLKKHRALPDARAHLEEFCLMKEMMKNAVGI